MKTYANRHWETGEKNIFEKECYLLHFNQFNEKDEPILGFVQDEKNEKEYIYSSEILNVEYDTITADSVEEAKEILEKKIVEHFNEKILELEETVRKFNELK